MKVHVHVGECMGMYVHVCACMCMYVHVCAHKRMYVHAPCNSLGGCSQMSKYCHACFLLLSMAFHGSGSRKLLRVRGYPQMFQPWRSRQQGQDMCRVIRNMPVLQLARRQRRVLARSGGCIHY